MYLLAISFSMVLIAGTATADPAASSALLAAPAPANTRSALDLDGVCDRMMSAAGVGITSGKIMLLRPSRGGRTQVAVDVGKSRLMPLFDVSFSSASLLAHFKF